MEPDLLAGDLPLAAAQVQCRDALAALRPVRAQSYFPDLRPEVHRLASDYSEATAETVDLAFGDAVSVAMLVHQQLYVRSKIGSESASLHLPKLQYCRDELFLRQRFLSALLSGLSMASPFAIAGSLDRHALREFSALIAMRARHITTAALTADCLVPAAHDSYTSMMQRRNQARAANLLGELPELDTALAAVLRVDRSRSVPWCELELGRGQYASGLA